MLILTLSVSSFTHERSHNVSFVINRQSTYTNPKCSNDCHYSVYRNVIANNFITPIYNPSWCILIKTERIHEAGFFCPVLCKYFVIAIYHLAHHITIRYQCVTSENNSRIIIGEFNNLMDDNAIKSTVSHRCWERNKNIRSAT